MSLKRLPLSHLELRKSPLLLVNACPWEWKSKARKHYNLWICTEGFAWFRSGGETYKVSPWTVFLFPPEMEIHGFSESLVSPIKNFTAHWWPEEPFVADHVFAIMGLHLREVDTAQSLMQSMLRLSVHEDALSKQQSEWALLQLLSLVWREVQTPKESSVYRLIYRQIERIRSGEDLFLSVEALAAEAKLSRIYYGRCFKQITKETPNQFLIRQRIERACMLLRDTDWTIEVLAERIGYNDVYFFCRQFKQIMQMTPRQYRQSMTPPN